MEQCPYDFTVKCIMDEPCKGCETKSVAEREQQGKIISKPLAAEILELCSGRDHTQTIGVLCDALAYAMFSAVEHKVGSKEQLTTHVASEIAECYLGLENGTWNIEVE